MHIFGKLGVAVRQLAFVLILMPVAGCVAMHTPVPEPLVEKAFVPQFEKARSWADELSPDFLADISLRQKQLRESGLAGQPLHFLALSGGGENGAFGAGVLNGWSAEGTRPEFEIVTGVSTGALIAPFAFLGQTYDEPLGRMYTNISTRDILVANPFGLLGGSSLTSNHPLANIIGDIVDAEFLGRIAAEYNRGRRLYVLTTNLEAQRPVLWDMGRIAVQGTPEARDLFRSVLLASAAIPGAFPPKILKVEADGKFYTELQVDGGTTANSFLAPLNVSYPNRSARKPVVHVIQDGKLSPEYQAVDPKTLKIVRRAIGTMSKYKNYGDIRRLYLLSEQIGGRFRLISVPSQFDVKSTEPFDKTYMNDLYRLGYDVGRSGTAWVSTPDVF